MSASASAILRGMRVILRALGLQPAKSTGVSENAPLKLFATIEFLAEGDLVDQVDRPEPPDGGTPAALPLPVLAQTIALATMYRPAQARPLAHQMAYTASRNVPKGRKPATLTKAVATSKPSQKAKAPRRATTAKAKPVVLVVRKKAPKRRHVWLSTQSRVIKPVLGNVVTMQTVNRTPRQTTRPSALTTVVRPLKIAA